MHFPPSRRSLVFGGSLVPVLLFVAAIAASTVIFFVFTRKKIQHVPAHASAIPQAASGPASLPAAAPSPVLASASRPASASGPVGSGGPPAVAMQPASPVASLGFARPADVGAQLARSLASGDVAAAAKLASASDPAQAASAAAVLGKIVGQMGYKLGPEDQVQVIGQVEGFTRLSIPLTKPGDPSSSLSLQLDLDRDQKMGWKIAKFHLPKELAGALAELPQAQAAAAPAAPMAVAKTAVAGPDGKLATVPVPVDPRAAAMAKSSPLFTVAETTDALSFANNFVKALLRHDFAEARKFIDDQKVQPQKLAGLCIVFEEGQYELRPAKPLIITVANPQVSWVIAQVQSEALQQSTEFGLELQRPDAATEWKVAGLNLSQILNSFAQSASKLGVPYTPLVRNPKGGESLALYFEYDRAELHPRAMKQLDIVAGLLKSDPNRKLNIAGHTDAKGEDSYNLRLSQLRAESVKRQLVALGVSADQVITSGLGKAQPLGPNQRADGTDDPEGRSRNRRAEIFLDF